MDDTTNDTTTAGSSNTNTDVTAGTKDGLGAADRDVVYMFGRRPSAQSPYPFNERQFARLLILRSRLEGAPSMEDRAAA